jgi:hypothetical protein
MGILSRLWHLLADGPFTLRGSQYHHFHRVVVPTSRGTSEIDHLIVSPYGVFVIELKDRSGWILGNATDSHWTAVHFKEQYRFQNPLHQNVGHLRALAEFLRLEPRHLRGVVVFRGDFEFKTPIPDGVLCHQYRSWVASYRDVLLDDAAVAALAERLRSHARHGWLAGREHARSVRARYSSKTTCPKCGGDLRIRTQRRGGRPGLPFLGCSRYPGCKFTKSLD